MSSTVNKNKQKTSRKKSTRRVVAKRATKSVKKHSRALLVPHKANNYRPHLIRPWGLTAVLFVALVVQLLYGFVTTGQLEVLGRVSNITTTELLEYTNRERDNEGLADLSINDKLSEAAFMKATDMFENNYWAHVSPSGVTPWKWIADVGYNYSIAGENLAKNYPTARATVDAWMASETHRENILNSQYADVGFAVVDGVLNGRATTLVVAMYGAPVADAGVSSVVRVAEVAAPVSGAVDNPLGYFASAAQSLSPATIVVLALFAVVAIVAVAAHHYRSKLPPSWRQGWRSHHGMFVFVGVVTLGFLLVLATGGGQI